MADSRKPIKQVQIEIRLETTNQKTLAFICLCLIEVMRSCLHEIIRLAGPEHGLAFKKRIIDQVKNSAGSGLPFNEETDALSTTIGIVENIVRFTDERGNDLENKD